MQLHLLCSCYKGFQVSLSFPPFLTDNAVILNATRIFLPFLTDRGQVTSAPTQQLSTAKQQHEVLTHQVSSLQTGPKQPLDQLKLQGQHMFWRVLKEVRNKLTFYTNSTKLCLCGHLWEQKTSSTITSRNHRQHTREVRAFGTNLEAGPV